MNFEGLTLDQWLELNHLICRRIDELREKETLQALVRLHVGMKVSFEARDGIKVGLVTKINRKSVIVLGEDEGAGGRKQYKVSPRLLTPLKEVK